MSEKQGFMIIVTAEDHKIIDIAMNDLLKTIHVRRGAVIITHLKL